MKVIKVGNGYVTNVELSCGKIATIDIDIDKQPVTFTPEDANVIKKKLEEYYKNKNIKIEIEINDF